MKRITRLSELYVQIGQYLAQYGDADIASIATHNTNNKQVKYTLHLTDVNSDWTTETGVITVHYEDRK